MPVLLESHVCPRCRAPALEFERSSVNPGPNDGALVCTHCRSAYPVRGGIPRFVPQDNYADSFGYQWNLHRRAQLDSYTDLPVSRRRVSEVTGWPEKLEGETILEAGCGAGRFTEILLSTGATVFAFDYSTAVDANYANNGRSPLLHLFQADILSVPLREQVFDKVLCLGVLQHTPDPAAAFASLARYVRPGGQFVVDVYAKRLSALLSWKYLLRPLTRRMDPRRLHRAIEKIVPALLPISGFLRSVAGRVGARLVPIVDYSHLGLRPEISREWAILDTFDMYAPAYDYPQTLRTVRRWFEDAGFESIAVRYGPNGVVGKGIRRREVSACAE